MSDLGRAIDQPLKHTAFQRAKLRFAIIFEDFRDRHTSGIFNFGIGIEEVQVQQWGNNLTNTRLAAAHQPDQHNRAVDEAVERLGEAFIPCLGHDLAFRPLY